MPTNKPETLTLANLQKIADEIQRESAAIRLRATALEEDGIQELSVTNYDQLRRAMEYLAKFSNAIRMSHFTLLEQKGAYKKQSTNGASSSSSPKKKRKRGVRSQKETDTRTKE